MTDDDSIHDTLPPAADDKRPLVDQVAVDMLDNANKRTGSHKAQELFNVNTQRAMADLATSIRSYSRALVIGFAVLAFMLGFKMWRDDLAARRQEAFNRDTRVQWESTNARTGRIEAVLGLRGEP